MNHYHLFLFINEFGLRYNANRVYGTMEFIDKTITNMDNKLLTYRRLTNG